MPVGYDGASVWTMLNDGTIDQVDANSGQIDYAVAVGFVSSDCTGPPLVFAPRSAQSPFALPTHAPVGDPLYTATPSTQSIPLGSFEDPDGTCSAGPFGGQTASVVPTGTTISTLGFTGPLTIGLAASRLSRPNGRRFAAMFGARVHRRPSASARPYVSGIGARTLRRRQRRRRGPPPSSRTDR